MIVRLSLHSDSFVTVLSHVVGPVFVSSLAVQGYSGHWRWWNKTPSKWSASSWQCMQVCMRQLGWSGGWTRQRTWLKLQHNLPNKIPYCWCSLCEGFALTMEMAAPVCFIAENSFRFSLRCPRIWIIFQEAGAPTPTRQSQSELRCWLGDAPWDSAPFASECSFESSQCTAQKWSKAASWQNSACKKNCAAFREKTMVHSAEGRASAAHWPGSPKEILLSVSFQDVLRASGAHTKASPDLWSRMPCSE